MQPFRRLIQGLLSVCLLCLVTLSSSAQEPTWVPVAELLLGSMGESDAGRMTEVMHRCTALNMTLSALSAEASPDVSKGYEEEALRLIQHGILIAMNSEKLVTGVEPDIEILSDVAVKEVKAMLGIYNKWMEANYKDNGSYFNSDLEIEMKGCELATRFIKQLAKN